MDEKDKSSVKNLLKQMVRRCLLVKETSITVKSDRAVYSMHHKVLSEMVNYLQSEPKDEDER